MRKLPGTTVHYANVAFHDWPIRIKNSLKPPPDHKYLQIRFTFKYRPSFILTSPPWHPVWLHQPRSETLNLWHLCKSVVTFSYLVTLLGFVPGYLKIILGERSTTSLTRTALFLFKTDQILHLRRSPREAEIGLRPHFPLLSSSFQAAAWISLFECALRGELYYVGQDLSIWLVSLINGTA